jgi:signal transduction histidine kinase
MVAVGELAAGMAHDFKNVLQTIISTLELIESRHNDPAAVRRLAAQGLRITDRGASLANRVLGLSRAAAESVVTADVLPSVTDVAEALSRTAGARIKLSIEQLSDELWRTAIDTNEFSLALLNLGLNARDAMPEGGAIKLLARNASLPSRDRRQRPEKVPSMQDRRGPPLALPGGDYVLVSVADTGQGMDASTLAQVGRPFFSTKPTGKGTGLGLSMAHSFAAQHGGKLRLISAPGKGTTAEIWLPRRSET